MTTAYLVVGELVAAVLAGQGGVAGAAVAGRIGVACVVGQRVGTNVKVVPSAECRPVSCRIVVDVRSLVVALDVGGCAPEERG